MKFLQKKTKLLEVLFFSFSLESPLLDTRSKHLIIGESSTLELTRKIQRFLRISLLERPEKREGLLVKWTNLSWTEIMVYKFAQWCLMQHEEQIFRETAWKFLNFPFWFLWFLPLICKHMIIKFIIIFDINKEKGLLNSTALELQIIFFKFPNDYFLIKQKTSHSCRGVLISPVFTAIKVFGNSLA